MADGFDDDLFNVFDDAEVKQQQTTSKGSGKSDITRYVILSTQELVINIVCFPTFPSVFTIS